jgi:phosphoglycolate phosphatase
MTSTGVLVDLNGTLIDSAPSILECFSRVFGAAEFTPQITLGPELIGPPLGEMLSRIVGSDDPILIGRLSTAFRECYDCVDHRSAAVYEGVNEALEQLAGVGARIYVMTNKRMEPTRKIISWLGWSNYFLGLYSADALDPALPSKSAVLKRVIDLHRIDVASAVDVGDRDEDKAAAMSNDLPFVVSPGVMGCGRWTRPGKGC